jgi:hypothetical protein
MELRNKNGGVEAPISISDLFNVYDSDEKPEYDENSFENTYETQILTIGQQQISVCQSSWHKTNANIVWPGTFILAEFLIMASARYSSGTLLELGSATGALAIVLTMNNFDIITRLV